MPGQFCPETLKEFYMGLIMKSLIVLLGFGGLSLIAYESGWITAAGVFICLFALSNQNKVNSERIK